MPSRLFANIGFKYFGQNLGGMYYYWLLKPQNQYYDPVSHITYVVCVNVINACRNLQFKVESELQIFEKLFHGIFINTHGVFFATKKCSLYLKKCNFVFVS